MAGKNTRCDNALTHKGGHGQGAGPRRVAACSRGSWWAQLFRKALLHLAAIRVDRPVRQMMIFAKGLLCSFLRLGPGLGERLEGVLAGVYFVAISAKHLLEESHTKATHCDLHCLLGHNKRILERIFDLPQRCVRECAEFSPHKQGENLIRPGRFFAWPRPKPMEGSVSFYRRPLFSWRRGRRPS